MLFRTWTWTLVLIFGLLTVACVEEPDPSSSPTPTTQTPPPGEENTPGDDDTSAPSSPSPTLPPTPTPATDDDQDGFSALEDCDDTNPAIYPAATEVCDGLDNDCNESIDDSAINATEWYRDSDEDGYGDSGDVAKECTKPEGYVADSDDCDDGDSSLNPETTWYLDYDQDGYGGTAFTLQQCLQPQGYVRNAEDCNDTDGRYHPGAAETDCADPNDYNCDGSVGYEDADQDGFPACETGGRSDCNDADANLHPGAEEKCDGLDNDCDGLIDAQDEDVVDASPWYADNDGDGYGDNTDVQPACQPVDGRVANGEDCNDSDAEISPVTVWYIDLDRDGFGADANTLTQCKQPSGYVLNDLDCNDLDTSFRPNAPETDCSDPSDYNCDGSVAYEDADEDGFSACDDCDDTNPQVNREALEVCDQVDNDCDGLVDDLDDDVVQPGVWYQDEDQDTYGNPDQTVQSCSRPTGYVSNAEDCDDTDAGLTPDTTWYIDLDRDGCGSDANTLTQCDQPNGYVLDSSDCRDNDPAFHPGALETDCADPNDYNCDGSVAYEDGDGDGYSACDECDDTNAAIHPDADERCDGIDNDCDTLVDDQDGDVVDSVVWYQDADGDGFGVSNATTSACTLPDGYASQAGDCDDSNAAIHPETVWYIDYDGDGYGSSSFSRQQCVRPAGYVSNAEDCNDINESINPEGTEACDGIDNNCNDVVDDPDILGAITFYRDADGDGHGTADASTSNCALPEGYATSSDDCDDTDATVYLDAPEICDGIDNDCDGNADGAVLGDTQDCAALSCLEIKQARPESTDGKYWLDPTSSGNPVQYLCDMSTDGGGWTLLIDWNYHDGETPWRTFFDRTVYNNMDQVVFDTSNYLYIRDGSCDADVYALAHTVEVPNGGEVLTYNKQYLYSFEESAWWLVGTISGSSAFANIRCQNQHPEQWSTFTAQELSYQPMTTCPDYDNYCSDCSSTIDDWKQRDLGAPLTEVHWRSFGGCSGDAEYVYDFVLYVR